MQVQELTPILNVTDIVASFDWFQKLGWKKCWDWGTPPTFGAVASGKCQIFLCQNGQGGRDLRPPIFGDDDITTTGVWMSWFLSSPADVDAAHALALSHGMTVTCPPTDEPWGVREFHLRHPDGHIFRVGAGTEEHQNK